ncbi:MAG TPA: ATP-binding protein [Gaiellaceae bacterium]|nr:ATP-binding protein [Gaiellaceae bacterium]
MTIRLRLTLIYGGLFLCSAVALLAITYTLVNHQYTSTFFVSSGRQALIAKAYPTKRLLGASPTPKGFIVPVGPKAFATNSKLVVAAAQGQSDAAVHKLFVDSAFALAVMTVISLWLGWVIAGRALRPLRTITETAREISASSLHRRLDLAGPDDELRQLGNTVDGLLGRLETSFEAQRQFVANASHELRTPLTLERTLLELALSDPNASIESYRHTCEQLLAVGEQQERLIEALLMLSRSQRGVDSHQPVDLAAIASAAAAAVDHDGLAFDTSIEPAHTTGNPRLVERLVANLVGNAIRHNVENGTVSLATETRGGRALLTITNSGPTIPPAELYRLFQPFQRLEGSRTNSHGLGLGLSIVRAVADAHDATIATDAPDDGGLRIQVSFPSS